MYQASKYMYASVSACLTSGGKGLTQVLHRLKFGLSDFEVQSDCKPSQEGEVEKHRIHGLILQADAKQQQVQDSIAARPRGGARDELISELIQSRLAVSRAQMNAEAGVSEQMIEEQQEVIAWLWRILEHAGMTQAQVMNHSIFAPWLKKGILPQVHYVTSKQSTWLTSNVMRVYKTTPATDELY